MSWEPLVGLICLCYCAFVIYLTNKKPRKIWEMSKVRFFRRFLGEKGTVFFFYIWALAIGLVGIWLFSL